MGKIVLTEDQLNRLVEMKHKNVFKDEHKMKEAVESHLSEEKELCGCGCEIGKCECGPECKKCDCGKKKLQEQDKYEEGDLPFSLNNSFFGVMADILVEISNHHNNPEIRSMTNFLSLIYDQNITQLQDIRLKDEDLINAWRSMERETEELKSDGYYSDKDKETKEEWEPTGSVGVSGVAQDVARKGMNTLWENEDEDKKSLYCVCLKNNENVVVGYYRSIEIASEVFHGFTHNDNNPTTIREVKDHFEDGYKFCLLKRLERKPIKCYDNRKDVEEYIYKNSDKPEPSELYFSKFETNKVTQQPQDGQLSESVMNNFKRLIK